MCALANGALATLVTGIMLHSITHIEILKDTLTNLLQHVDAEKEEVSRETTDEKGSCLYDVVTGCIEHHVTIIK